MSLEQANNEVPLPTPPPQPHISSCNDCIQTSNETHDCSWIDHHDSTVTKRTPHPQHGQAWFRASCKRDTKRKQTQETTTLLNTNPGYSSRTGKAQLKLHCPHSTCNSTFIYPTCLVRHIQTHHEGVHAPEDADDWLFIYAATHERMQQRNGPVTRDIHQGCQKQETSQGEASHVQGTQQTR